MGELVRAFGFPEVLRGWREGFWGVFRGLAHPGGPRPYRRGGSEERAAGFDALLAMDGTPLPLPRKQHAHALFRGMNVLEMRFHGLRDTGLRVWQLLDGGDSAGFQPHDPVRRFQ